MQKQLFSPIHNLIARVTIVVGILVVGGGYALTDTISRSSIFYYTKHPRPQPIPFSHKHHLALGIDCRYCHTTVEHANFANIPPTKTCMNCHNVMWNDAPMLEPVRKSFLEDEALEWVRVNDLPDFVYFKHSAHVNKGIGCATCHGRVDQMPLTWREEPLFMKWCLDCHRDPAQFVRPKDKVFDMAYDPKSLSREAREALVEEYGIELGHDKNRMTNCSLCHH